MRPEASRPSRASGYGRKPRRRAGDQRPGGAGIGPAGCSLARWRPRLPTLGPSPGPAKPPRVTVVEPGPPYYCMPWLVPAIHVGAQTEPSTVTVSDADTPDVRSLSVEPEQRPLGRRSRQRVGPGGAGGDRRGLERQQGRQGLLQLGGVTRTLSGSAAWSRRSACQ